MGGQTLPRIANCQEQSHDYRPTHLVVISEIHMFTSSHVLIIKINCQFGHDVNYCRNETLENHLHYHQLHQFIPLWRPKNNGAERFLFSSQLANAVVALSTHIIIIIITPHRISIITCRIRVTRLMLNIYFYKRCF